MSEKLSKEKITLQIQILSQLLGDPRTVNQDLQSAFVSSSVEVILRASQNENHILLFTKYLEEFMDGVIMMEGEMKVEDFLSQQENICSN